MLVVSSVRKARSTLIWRIASARSISANYLRLLNLMYGKWIGMVLLSILQTNGEASTYADTFSFLTATM